MKLVHQSATVFLLSFTALIEVFIGSFIAMSLVPLVLNNLNGLLSNHTAHHHILFGIALCLPALGQLIFARYWGKLSDSLGRKKAMMILLSTSCACMLGLSVGILFNQPVLFFSFLFFQGATNAAFGIAQASLIDITKHNEKIRRLNYLEIAAGIALLLGPTLCAKAIAHHQSDYIMYLALFALRLISLAMLLCFWRNQTMQTNPQHRRKLSKQPLLLLAYWCIFMFGFSLYLQFFNAFLINGLTLSPQTISNVYLFMGIVFLSAQIGIVMPFARRLNPKKTTLIFGSLVGCMVIAMACSHSLSILHLIIIVYMCSMSLFLPSVHAWLSNHVSPNDQGTLFGNALSLRAMSTVLASLAGGMLLGTSTRLPLLLGGFIMIVIALLVLKHAKSDQYLNK